MANDQDISIVGAREHNLKDVSLCIPKNKITVFTGVSGSGKSSIVFDTIAVEAQRQLNGIFSAFVRNHLPRYERPAVDIVENLTTPVVVDQRPPGANARSTVGTTTDIFSVIRLLFSRFGTPRAEGLTFSFNDPASMCEECGGLGQVRQADPDLLVDRSLSLADGAIQLASHKVGSMDWQLYACSGRLDPEKLVRDYTDDEWHTLMHGSGGTKVTVTTKNTSNKLAYEGLLDRFVRTNLHRDLSTLGDRARAAVEGFITEQECPACGGARLNRTALSSLVAGRSIAEWSRMEIADLIGMIDGLGDGDTDPVAVAMARSARDALQRVADAGLGYLSLERGSTTLSGGEGQRLKMVRHLGSSLIGMTYIFDEPSSGLHARDVGRLADMLRALRDRGNTVLVVEHDPDLIRVADHVVDVGPGAGVHGGQVVFTGSFDELLAADTPTGRALHRERALAPGVRRATGQIAITGAHRHNLKDVSVDVPTGVLTVVSGVSGSGKSTLVSQLVGLDDVVVVDQSPITASTRSTPATYLGLMDPIRKLFAKASGAPAGLFSFNSTGACTACQGRGVIVTELPYMDPITTRCTTCEGRRFDEAVLAHRLRGLSVADVLELPAEEAAEFFTEPDIAARLDPLVEVGLPYLSLGQALSTLSGGERQRIKLAAELRHKGSVYVLDEPTTGLHLSDVDNLLALIDRIVDDGNTVVTIEHDLAVIARADWVIDLGPGGGKDGGQVVFTGPPADLVHTDTPTGQHLRAYLAG